MDNVVTLDGDLSYVTVQTPQGMVIVSCFFGVGTQVAVYDEPDHNPVGIFHLRPRNQQ